jgi:hypothetical protein
MITYVSYFYCRDVKLNVPTAPEVGLYLDECMFTSYNKKRKDTHEPVSMEPYCDTAESSGSCIVEYIKPTFHQIMCLPYIFLSE